MSDLLNGWTATGAASTAVGIGLALWRRLSPPRSGQPPWYVRLFRAISAAGRLQIAEGDLDYAKESLLWKNQQLHEILEENRRLSAENERLFVENERIRSSASTASSGPSSDGSTARRGVRTPKKPTT